MVERANALLRKEGAAIAGFAISAAPVADTSTATTGTNVVRVTAGSADPNLAATAANAYARAFIDWRTERVQEQITAAVDALKKQLALYSGAAKESTDYLVLQQRLQDMQILKATATGNFRMLVPASAPETPVSPKPVRSAVLGFAVGLFLAIGLALAA